MESYTKEGQINDFIKKYSKDDLKITCDYLEGDEAPYIISFWKGGERYAGRIKEDKDKYLHHFYEKFQKEDQIKYL